MVVGLWLAMSIVAPGAHAGGWTQARDAYYLKVWARGIFGNQAYFADGSAGQVPAFRDLQLNVYAEYGVTDAWTAVVFGTPTGYASAERDTFYVGPVGLGVRRALTTGTWRLALEGQYGIESGVGGIDLYRRDGEQAVPDAPRYVPAVDNHRGELQLQLGRGLPFGWMTLMAGMRMNSGDGIDHAAVGHAQLGYRASERWTLQLNVMTYQPLGAVSVTNVSGVGQTRYVGIGIGASYRFGDGAGLVAAVDGAAGGASNAGAPSLQLGAELQ